MSDTPVIPANARVIAPSYDAKGDPAWHSVTSAPDDSYAHCQMVPRRIIPVIFVPGVMGSNLIEKGKSSDKAVKWRLDTPTSAGVWSLPHRGAKSRKQYLRPEVMDVDPGGAIPGDAGQMPVHLRERGWGEVGALSYRDALVWLERALNDFDSCHSGERTQLMREGLGALLGEKLLSRDEVGLSYRYRFPVWACGYNWLDSNAASAARLGRRIDEAIRFYTRHSMPCEKVIIVTHSMGGLVARYCSEVDGYRGKIFGIVHGVMPALGAAAVYRRFKAGTEDPTSWWNLEGAATASALGNDAAEMTAVLSSAPGPLQLLPTPEYGNGWLQVTDGKETFSLPRSGDPYSEIYAVRGKWWSMAEDRLINPLNTETDPVKLQRKVDADWEGFANNIDLVEQFHEKIKGRYHPTTHAFYGESEANRAYGTVTWRAGHGATYQGASQPLGELLDGSLPGRSPVGATTFDQIGRDRFVEVSQKVTRFTVSAPEEPGDGTVPRRSGLAPKDHCRSFARVAVGHEPAFNPSQGADNVRACRFTLRAIVQIAQDVVNTSLKYE